MNIQKILVALVFVVLTAAKVPLIAQVEAKTINTSFYFETPLVGRRYNPPPNGEGSPYLYKAVVKGDIILITGDTVKSKWLNLDCLKNELIWMVNESEYVCLDTSFIRAFTLYSFNNEPCTFEKINFRLPLYLFPTNNYVESFFNGKAKLFIYRGVNIEKDKIIGNEHGLLESYKYSQFSICYFQIGNLPINHIELKKKSLINAYPQYKSQIRKILRENKIGVITTEWQMIQAIKVLNSNLNIVMN